MVCGGKGLNCNGDLKVKDDEQWTVLMVAGEDDQKYHWKKHFLSKTIVGAAKYAKNLL